MTISLHIDTIPQVSRNLNISAWHETFGDLTTPVYFNAPGGPFTIPADDAKHLGLFLLGIKDVVYTPNAYFSDLTSELQAADISGDADTPAELAAYLLDRGWVKL